MSDKDKKDLYKYGETPAAIGAGMGSLSGNYQQELEGARKEREAEIKKAYATEFLSESKDLFKDPEKLAFLKEAKDPKDRKTRVNKIVDEAFLSSPQYKKMQEGLEWERMPYEERQQAAYEKEKKSIGEHVGKLGEEVNREFGEYSKTYNPNWDIFKPMAMRQADLEDPSHRKDMATYQRLLYAKNLTKDTQKLYSEATKEDKNPTKAALRGAGSKLFNPETWDLGISELDRNLHIKNAAEKFEKGEELTKDERYLMDALAENLAVNAYYGSDIPRQYKWGEIAGESLPFMLEFALNPVAGGGKGLAKTIAKYGIKKLGATGAGKTAVKAGARAVGDIASSLGMVGTTGAAKTGADALARMAGAATFDTDEGRVSYTGHEGDEGIAPAIIKSILSQTIEYQSEKLGSSGLGKVIGRAVPKGVKATGFGKAIGRLNNSDIVKGLKNFEKRAEWSGVLGEWGEEAYGTAANAVLVGDQKLTDLTDVDKQIDTFMGLALTGGAMSAVNTTGYAADRIRTGAKLRSADKAADRMFENWGQIKTQLADKTVDERADVVKNVLQRKDISIPAKNAFANYAGALTYKDGLVSAEGEITQQRRKNAQMDGERLYETIQDKKSVALRNLNAEKLNLESELGEVANLPLSEIEDSPETTPPILAAAKKYDIIKREYEAIQNRLQQEVDDFIAPQIKAIDDVTRKDGSIVEVNLGDDKLNQDIWYVTDGNIVLDAETGAVDRKASGKIVYAVNGKGGKKQIATSKIQYAKIDNAEEIKSGINEMAREKFVVPFQNSLSGVSRFDIGEQVEFFDDKGETVAGTIGAKQGQTVTIVSNDGKKNFTYTESDLQNRIATQSIGAYHVRDEFEVVVDGDVYKASIEDISDGKALVAVPGAPTPYLWDVSTEQLDAMRVKGPVGTVKTTGETPENETVSPNKENVLQPETEIEQQNDISPEKKVSAFPLTKSGEIDYDQITDNDTFLSALRSEFGNEASDIVDEYRKQANKKLKEVSRIQDPVKRKRAEKQARAQVERFERMHDVLIPKTSYESRIAAIEQGKITECEANMGEYLSLRDYLLRNIASGKFKFLWNSDGVRKGLKDEILASKNTERERKKRIGFLDNKGYTPESLAHEIWENAGQGSEISESWFGDTQDIRNEIIDILLRYDTPTSMINAATELRKQPGTTEEYYENFVDPAVIAEYESNEESQNDILRSLPADEDDSISQQEIEYYFGHVMADFEKSINFEDYDNTDERAGIDGDRQDAVQGTGGTDVARGSEVSGTYGAHEETDNFPDGGEIEGTGERGAPDSIEQPIAEGAGEVIGRPVEEQESRADEISADIQSEADKVNQNPTEAQKEAGNYKKGHVTVQGFDITIENPEGSVRSGVDESGKEWSIEMQNHYGYFKRTEGKDGDQIDVFIGPNPESGKVFVVDQVNPQKKDFDESKVMMGFNTAEEAKAAYLSNYEEGWQGLGAITETDVDSFKKWLYDGAKQRKPFSEYSENKNDIGIPISEQDSHSQETKESDTGIPVSDNYRNILDEELRGLSDSEIETIENQDNAIVNEAYNAVKSIPVEKRYDAVIKQLKDKGVSDAVVEEIGANNETDFYMELEKALEDKIGKQSYDQWISDFQKRHREKSFDDISGQLNADYILQQPSGQIDFGDPVYDFNYFGFRLETKGNKYNLSVYTKQKSGTQYNPYYIEKHEGVTAEQAADIMETEAKRMLRIGTPIPPLSALTEKLNESDIESPFKISQKEKSEREKYLNEIDEKVRQNINNSDAVTENKVNEPQEKQQRGVQLQLDWTEELPYKRNEAISSDAGIADLQRESGYGEADDNSVTFVERQLSDLGQISFMGSPLTGTAKIKHPNDIAFLFKNLESAASENVFAVLIDKDDNFKVLYVSTGASTSSIVDNKQIIGAALESGAERVVMVHNHPSGNLMPSWQDYQAGEKLTKAGEEAGIEVLPGIIINLDSGKYVEFYPGTGTHLRIAKEDVEGETPPVNVYQFDRLTLHKPSSEKTYIKDSKSVAEFLSKQKRGSVDKIQALVLDQKMGINKYLLIDGGTPTKELISMLMGEVAKHGERIILSSNAEFAKGKLQKIKNALKTMDSDLLDVLTIQQDQDIIDRYVSYADEGLMEPGGKYLKTDREGNYIGDGKHHVPYDEFDFSRYPQIESKVDYSESTESVYVTYENTDNNKRVTVRFSNHVNNAVKFGDQLNGLTATEDEVLFRLGLKQRVFIPDKHLSISNRKVSKKEMSDYEETDKTIQEMYALGGGADISKYKGKLAKGSNYLILGDTVEELNVMDRDITGQHVRTGKYSYIESEDSVVKEAENSYQTATGQKITSDDLSKVVPDYNGFIGKVFSGVKDKKPILADARSRGMDLRGAVEKYMSEVSDPTELSRIRELLGVNLPDNALRYLLWKNANPNDGSAEWKARELAVGRQLDSNVLFRAKQPPSKLALNEYEKRVRSRYNKGFRSLMFGIEEGWFDRMSSLRILQNAITENGYIRDKANAYLMENQLSSRNEAEIERYVKHMIEPVYKAAVDVFGPNLKLIDYYLNAKHGLERNEGMANEEAERFRKQQIERVKEKRGKKELSTEEYAKALASIDLSVQRRKEELLKKDYSGLTAIAEERGFEENFKGAAENIVNETEGKVPAEKIEALWNAINKATKWMLQKQYDSGMMSKDVFEKINSMYKYYVPLRGFSEATATDLYEYIQNAPSDFNGVLKTAKGRTSRADSPFASIMNMAESGIMQANRNKMKQAFYRLVATNPSNYASIQDVWLVKKGDGWVEEFPEIPENATGDQVWEATAEFNNKMEELANAGLAARGKNKLDVGVKIGKAQAGEHAVRVWVGGEEKVIYINGNPRAAQAINGLTNYYSKDRGEILEFGKFWMRQMAANFTSRNPAFMVTNFMRDIQFALMSAAVKEGGRYSAQLAVNALKVPKTIAANIWGEGGGAYDGYWKEFVGGGGETGYANIHSMDYHRKYVNKRLNELSGQRDFIKPFRVYAEQVGNANRLIEDISRFATYVTSREVGRSIERSVADAKDITINFNRKGSGGFGGEIVNTFFLFANPALQSLRQMGMLAKRNPVGFIAALGMSMAMGAFVPLLNDFLMLMFGDDDNKDLYWNLSDWTRRNHLVIYAPWMGKDRFTTIALPHELRGFYGLGEMAYSAGVGRLRHANIPLEATKQLANMLPIDPTGGRSSLIPDVARPLAEAYWFNRNFMDRPIYKDTPWNKLDPEWAKAYKGTSKWLVEGTKWLNESTGGDDVVKGKLDFNPAKLQHAFGGYVGGAWTTYTDLVNVAYDLISGEGASVNRIPIANKIVRTSDDRSRESRINNEYFYYRDWMTDYEHREKGYESRLGDEKYREKYRRLLGGDETGMYQYAKAMTTLINDAMKEDEGEANKLKEKFVNEMWEMENKKR